MTDAEPFRQVASIIAMHPGRRVVGAERLQSTVMLLQRRGMNTTYDFSVFGSVPYSDGLQAETQLWESMGLVKQSRQELPEGRTQRTFEAQHATLVPEVLPLEPSVKMIANAPSEVLKLATIYDTYRQVGFARKEARAKVMESFEGASRQRVAAALWLLRCLGIRVG